MTAARPDPRDARAPRSSRDAAGTWGRLARASATLGAVAGLALLMGAGSPPRPNGPGPESKDDGRDQTHIARQSVAEAREHAARAQTGAGQQQARTRASRDASRLPRMYSPTVQVREEQADPAPVGWSASLDAPEFNDRRRRFPPTRIPEPYVHAVRVGERFVFDVFIAGNPAGMAEAGVTEYIPDPRGDYPQGSGRYRIEGRAVTSGVVSLLSSMEDRINTTIDEHTGAVVSSTNTLVRSGLGTSKYKRRVVETEFEGRGHIRIVDTRDDKSATLTRDVPRDTFDPMSAMAWVRSLDLDEGEQISSHVLDGRTLMRVDVVGRGKAKLDPMPSVATGLGVTNDDVYLLEGTLSRVDRHGVVREDKRKYTFRAYVTRGERRLLLSIETDMWIGVLRLVLNRYDPPAAG